MTLFSGLNSACAVVYRLLLRVRRVERLKEGHLPKEGHYINSIMPGEGFFSRVVYTVLL